MHFHMMVLLTFWILCFYIITFFLILNNYFVNETYTCFCDSICNSSSHPDRRAGVLWRLLLRQNTRDVSYRHSDGVQKASLRRPFYDVLRTLFWHPQEVGRKCLLALHVGSYGEVLRTSVWDVLGTSVGDVLWRYL